MEIEPDYEYEYVYETAPVKKAKKKAVKKIKKVKKIVGVQVEPVKKTVRKKFEFTPQEYNEAGRLIETVPGKYLDNMKNVNDYAQFSKLTQDYKIKYKKEFEDPKKLALLAKHKGYRVLTGDFDGDGKRDVAMIDPNEMQILVFNGHVIKPPGFSNVLEYYDKHDTVDKQTAFPLYVKKSKSDDESQNIFKYILEKVKEFAKVHNIKRRDIGYLNQVASAIYSGIVFPLMGNNDAVKLLKWSHDSKDKNIASTTFTKMMKTNRARDLILPYVKNIIDNNIMDKEPMNTTIGFAFRFYPFQFVEEMDKNFRNKFANVVQDTSPILMEIFNNILSTEDNVKQKYQELLDAYRMHVKARHEQLGTKPREENIKNIDQF